MFKSILSFLQEVGSDTIEMDKVEAGTTTKTFEEMTPGERMVHLESQNLALKITNSLRWRI